MTQATTMEWVQAIIHAHADRFAGFPAQPVPSSHVLKTPSPAALAALQACSQLGFIADDAACLAHAWQQQTQRTGQFDAQVWPQHLQDFDHLGNHHFHTQAADKYSPSQPHIAQNQPTAFAPTGFAVCPKALGLYAVLPDAQWVRRMAHAGVPTVQLRFKSDDPIAIQKEVDAAVRAVEGTNARLFINDHWQAALAAQAYGVHVGQEDLDALPAEALDQLRNSGTRLGVSTHGYAEMIRAHHVRPSYIALGAVFPTTLKKMRTVPQGLGRLQAYAQLMHSYPLVAIGGIGIEQLPAVLATGVGSVAAVRALTQTQDPEANVLRWIQIMQADEKSGM